MGKPVTLELMNKKDDTTETCKIHGTKPFMLGDSPVCVECKLECDHEFISEKDKGWEEAVCEKCDVKAEDLD